MKCESQQILIFELFSEPKSREKCRVMKSHILGKCERKSQFLSCTYNITIKNTPTTLTFADKTTNMYKLTKEEHNKLLTDAVTSTYKKAEANVESKIMSEGKELVKNKNVYLTNGKNEAFITLKDHKPNFQNNPKVRLINPANNELGRISKSILDNVNQQIKSNLRINQWKDTKEVLQWFKNITEKTKHNFVIFDIMEFYPSISLKLINDAISFAMQHTEIPDDDIRIIKHARKSLLFHNEQPWVKNTGDLFDVTMGAYDGAEVFELVGIFLQNTISQHYNKSNFGLYRDDGLAVFKKLQKIFKKHQLEIVIECNKKVVDYLDVTLNLNDGTFKPYRKPDNNLQH